MFHGRVLIGFAFLVSDHLDIRHFSFVLMDPCKGRSILKSGRGGGGGMEIPLPFLTIFSLNVH